MSNEITMTMRSGDTAIHIHSALIEVNAVPERVDGAGISAGFVGLTLANPEDSQRVRIYLRDLDAVRKLAAELIAAADEVEAEKLALTP